MRNVLPVVTAIAFVFTAASTYGQTPSASDPLAIGGKDTAWFMDRVGRPDTDSEPQAPFKIMGNVYYIGANNIASILVATPQGHILIDTGTQKMAAVVFPNMVKLGFKPADIKLMLISHAHYDHMETMETIRRITGATVAALEAEVPALISGHDLSSNETWGQEPIQVGRVLKSGDDITLGGSTIKGHLDAGPHARRGGILHHDAGKRQNVPGCVWRTAGTDYWRSQVRHAPGGCVQFVQSLARDESRYFDHGPSAESAERQAGCIVGEQASQPARAAARAVDEDD